jgi:hypothetical protein
VALKPTLLAMSTTEVRREVIHANGIPPPDLDLPVRDYSDCVCTGRLLTTSFHLPVPREPR